MDSPPERPVCRRSRRSSHGGEAAGLRRLHALQDIRRIAAGADCDGDVAFLAVGPNLAGKEFVKPVIVGDAGDGGNVGGEGNGRQRSTLPFIPADEFGGDVGSIGGTASVAEEQYFVSFAEGRGDQLRDLHDAVGMFAGELLLDCRALGKSVEDDVLSLRSDFRRGVTPVKRAAVESRTFRELTGPSV